ncbi:MAG: hypothetical protein WB770_06495 [Acidimicrobiales bacterium]
MGAAPARLEHRGECALSLGRGASIDPREYLARVETVLSRDFKVEHPAFRGRPALAGYRSDFRWGWFASRLDTTVALTVFAHDEPFEAALDGYLEDVLYWGLRQRKVRRSGLEPWNAAIAVAVLTLPSEIPPAWARRAHGHRVGSLGYPVAVDLVKSSVVQPEVMVIGRRFASYLREITDRVVAAPLKAQ